jgi:hypothetical protein
MMTAAQARIEKTLTGKRHHLYLASAVVEFPSGRPASPADSPFLVTAQSLQAVLMRCGDPHGR